MTAPTPAEPATIALAWHDTVCPEAEDCRDRPLHAASQQLASTGLLAQFLDRLTAMRPAPDDSPSPYAEGDWGPECTCADSNWSSHRHYIGDQAPRPRSRPVAPEPRVCPICGTPPEALCIHMERLLDAIDGKWVDPEAAPDTAKADEGCATSVHLSDGSPPIPCALRRGHDGAHIYDAGAAS